MPDRLPPPKPEIVSEAQLHFLPCGDSDKIAASDSIEWDTRYRTELGDVEALAISLLD